jgi:hypothetical protein
MSWGRMHYQASRFVDYEKRFILMKDMKGDGFRLYIKRLGSWDDQQNSVTGFNLVTGLHHPVINGDVAVFY